MTSHALKSFWKCYDQLPAHIQKLADKNFALFKANPRHPSLGFAKKGEIYTVEIGHSYRALLASGTVITTGSGSAHMRITISSSSKVIPPCLTSVQSLLVGGQRSVVS